MRNSAKRIQALQEIDQHIINCKRELKRLNDKIDSLQDFDKWAAKCDKQKYEVGLDYSKKRKFELEKALTKSSNQEIYAIAVREGTFYQECSEEDLVAYMKYYYPDISYVYKKVRTTLPEIKK